MKLIAMSFYLFAYGLYTDSIYIYFNRLIAARIASGKHLTSPQLIFLSKKCSDSIIKFKRLEKIFCTEIAKRREV